MTRLAPIASPRLAALQAAAAAAGLAVRGSASWPETDADVQVKPLAGFVESTFNPLLAEVADRVLRRRGEPAAPGRVTAVVMVTALGDITSATHVAAAVDAGERVRPLLFFQSVPNAVAGYVAARWQLTGPVVCVDGISAGLDAAALLIDDADADEALVVCIDLAVTGDDRDRAAALLVTGSELAPRELAPDELAPLELAPLELAPLELAPLELAPDELAPRELKGK